MDTAVNRSSKNINIPVPRIDLLTLKPENAGPAGGDHTHSFAMGGSRIREDRKLLCRPGPKVFWVHTGLILLKLLKTGRVLLKIRPACRHLRVFPHRDFFFSSQKCQNMGYGFVIWKSNSKGSSLCLTSFPSQSLCNQKFPS